MDNVRLILWFALLGALYICYTTWVQDYAPPPPEPAHSAPSGAAPPQARDPGLPALEDIEGASPPTAEVPGPGQPADAAPARKTVHVTTDVLDTEIGLDGGDLVRTDLLQYPVDKHRPDELVRLLDYAPDRFWVFQTGLRYAEEGPEANHLATYRSAQSSYSLTEGADELVVRLDWADSGDLAVSKIYTFRRGQYAVDLEIRVENKSSEVWRGRAYSRLVRLHNPPERSYFSVASRSFTGPVLYDGDRSERLDFDDLAEEPIDRTNDHGWLASIQHHFLGAIVPPPDDQTRYLASTTGRRYVLTALSPIETVAPAGTLSYPIRFFVGPKLQDQLKATAQQLVLTVDYGLLTPLSDPLFWILTVIHDWIGNWGWAIIIVATLIKLVFYKLTAISGRSAAKMRRLAPRMKALQERYKDDRQALSQAVMELYKREKVNPAAGCLPVLIQMPFIYAFYWVLVESVEMRQAPFLLWIDDLSSRDPYFVLPILMGAAMLFQTRLQPAPPDPTQARIMQIMPIAFTAMFAFFPAGLVLYWLTNTVTSIAQQWRINYLVAKEG